MGLKYIGVTEHEIIKWYFYSTPCQFVYLLKDFFKKNQVRRRQCRVTKYLGKIVPIGHMKRTSRNYGWTVIITLGRVKLSNSAMNGFRTFQNVPFPSRHYQSSLEHDVLWATWQFLKVIAKLQSGSGLQSPGIDLDLKTGLFHSELCGIWSVLFFYICIAHPEQ